MTKESHPTTANDARKGFNRTLFWSLVIAFIVILAVFYFLAFARQAHHGHGQADPQSTMLPQAQG